MYSLGCSYVSPSILIVILLYTMYCSFGFKMQICETKRNYFCLGHISLWAIFMDNCQLIVSTIHSYTLLFSVISFLNYFCWKELMLIAFSLNLFSLRQNLSFHTQLITKCGITVDVDLSFLSSFRTSGPYQTGYVRNYTSHVSHS